MQSEKFMEWTCDALNACLLRKYLLLHRHLYKNIFAKTESKKIPKFARDVLHFPSCG